MNRTIADPVIPDSVIPDAQVEAYREKGFVVVEDIYSPHEVARMCEVLDEIVDAARGVRTHDVEGSWDAHRENMIAGEPTIEPRMAPAPVRLPFPGAERVGSIYENQSVVRNRYFERDASSARAEAGIQGT